MIVLLERPDGLRLERVRLRDRVTARLHGSALDGELAAGASPESSLALALHAEHLHAASQRRLLARSLRRVGAASEPRTVRRFGVPIDRDEIRRARYELETLATRLAAPEPVDVRGVARVRSLLADGTGPLYRKSAPGQLQRELVAALTSLDPSAE